MRLRLAEPYVRSLWAFSVDFYAQSGVSSRLIDWQDQHGIDVNVVLCLCWHTARGMPLDTAAIHALIAAGEPWRVHVIAPVRAARRAIKDVRGLAEMPNAQTLREQLLKVEIDLERAAQTRLQQASEAHIESRSAERVPVLAGAEQVDTQSDLARMLEQYFATRSSRPPLAQQRELGRWLTAFVSGA